MISRIFSSASSVVGVALRRPWRWRCSVICVAVAAASFTPVIAPAQITDGSKSSQPRIAERPLLAKSESSVLDKLRGLTESWSGADEFLTPEKAFRVEADALDHATIVVSLTPQPGYYLYRDKMRFELTTPGESKITAQEVPRGEKKNDPNFGETEVFHRRVDVLLRVQHPAAAPRLLEVQATYQGCAEKGLCYAPIKKLLTVALPAAVEAPRSLPSSPVGPIAAANAAGLSSVSNPLSEDSSLAALIRGGNILAMLGVFFVAGLLLTFTPCVFPMIPILSGIIVGQGTSMTRMRGVLLSATYVLGMAMAYSLAGIAAGLSGNMLSSALQNAWVLGAFAAVFVALALAMFGFYELQLPSFLQTRLLETSNRMQGGRLAGVFAMGALSAIIVSPCVTAPLAGALLAISQSREVLRGGVALFAMALGMGVPLIVVGASAGSLLPKAGAWMQSVKNLFGVVLLGMAIWLVSPLIAAGVQMALWGALLICSAIYLHALDPLPINVSGWKKLCKGAGVISLLVGGALILGALSGGRDLLQPLAGVRLSGAETTPGAQFRRVKSVADLEQAIAMSDGKKIMLDFYADWCAACKEMERFTFADATVQMRLRELLLLQADVTQSDNADAVLLKRFGLFGPPGIIFFDARGAEIRPARVIGFKPADEFLASLDHVLALP